MVWKSSITQGNEQDWILKLIDSIWFHLSLLVVVFVVVPATTFFILYIRYGNFLASVLGAVLMTGLVHTPIDFLYDKWVERSKKQKLKK